ncbi:MAG: M23 family metallopeptidase [Firmicutes bacterium]|nr:M23 family metallopeptidase [Bacillota bacterium]
MRKSLFILPLVLVLLLNFTAPGIKVQSSERDFIKWIEFNASSKIMTKAQRCQKKLKDNNIANVTYFDLLAYVALKNGNNFNFKKDSITLDKLIKDISKLEKYRDNKYFKYYKESFAAVLGGIIDGNTGATIGYHPIAKGNWYSSYNDFGTSRSFGFKRRHLGHDLFGRTGAQIMAIEGGTITELGWNRYGGWRVGIRSHCTKRFYYYAHLRKGKPFAENLKIGDTIKAGQLIGFLGNTGYSNIEDVNMKNCKPHLHFGLQIIFDKSQEDGNGEIWVDPQQICSFLSNNRATVK